MEGGSYSSSGEYRERNSKVQISTSNEYGTNFTLSKNSTNQADDQPNYEYFVASALVNALQPEANKAKTARGWELEIYTDGSATTKPGGGRRSYGRAYPSFLAGWCFVAYIRNLATGHLTKV